MKRIFMILVFVLSASCILANDWKVVSNTKTSEGEAVYLANVKTGMTCMVAFTAYGIIYTTFNQYSMQEYPNYYLDSCKAVMLNAGMKGNLSIQINAEKITKEIKIQLMRAIADYQKINN